MSKINQSFQLQLNYDVHFCQDVFDVQNHLLKDVCINQNSNPSKCLVYVDKGLADKNPELLNQIKNYFAAHNSVITICANPYVLAGGEKAKNDFTNIKQIYNNIHENKICKQSYIIAIGGGAFLDMIGFAASTAHRGVRLIRIPTTVLGQNDSGIGVKNSVNWFGKKNFIGSFSIPFAVINDVNFLKTLDERDWRSGIAEAIKVALIKDKDFFEEIYSNIQNYTQRNVRTMTYLIQKCAELHLQHIKNSGDPYEYHSSRPLDYGHWAAHKLESLSDYTIRHGEAVALGICLDSIYSVLVGTLSQINGDKILRAFHELGFTLWVSEFELRHAKGPRKLFSGLDEFKEHLGGQLTISMLDEIGSSYEIHKVDLALYEKALTYLKEFSNTQNIPWELE